jgi:hypothetical protein
MCKLATTISSAMTGTIRAWVLVSDVDMEALLSLSATSREHSAYRASIWPEPMSNPLISSW